MNPKYPDSGVTISRHATVYHGADAVNLFRAQTLKTALRMYIKTGMLVSRSVTPRTMLVLAKEYSGKTYLGPDKYTEAMEDVHKWIDTMKAAMPISEE